ncbi:predicted protein [Sclerotinia sclerotiorum 1980 UF-70]|uniref:Uncharacterized protein n=1 Tax=Sclerotinia sclerotiorum (strain ATCC 18683 / 1980 / Ss-1) TaxID=665079 RepID=A7EPF9_SCLS1|nr:predicted protein [Sclerotinia sclerotiorum 1980 UF-70]EDO04725.1 predicted protein [Sclerotinia sclerotiorum 1980 UF-70]
MTPKTKQQGKDITKPSMARTCLSPHRMQPFKLPSDQIQQHDSSVPLAPLTRKRIKGMNSFQQSTRIALSDR